MFPRMSLFNTLPSLRFVRKTIPSEWTKLFILLPDPSLFVKLNITTQLLNIDGIIIVEFSSFKITFIFEWKKKKKKKNSNPQSLLLFLLNFAFVNFRINNNYEDRYMNEQRDHSYSKLKFLKIFTEKFDEKFRCCLKKKKKKKYRTDSSFWASIFRDFISYYDNRSGISRADKSETNVENENSVNHLTFNSSPTKQVNKNFRPYLSGTRLIELIHISVQPVQIHKLN